jgi:hypothetical protein
MGAQFALSLSADRTAFSIHPHSNKKLYSVISMGLDAKSQIDVKIHCVKLVSCIRGCVDLPRLLKSGIVRSCARWC